MRKKKRKEERVNPDKKLLFERQVSSGKVQISE